MILTGHLIIDIGCSVFLFREGFQIMPPMVVMIQYIYGLIR